MTDKLMDIAINAVQNLKDENKRLRDENKRLLNIIENMSCHERSKHNNKRSKV